MQPNNAREVSPQQRYTTLLILWGAFFFNIILFLVLAFAIAPDSSRLTYNRALVIALTALGTCTALVSVFFRKKMTARAVEEQRPQSVSSAYIVAFALCELAALCGLLLRFTTNDPYFYFLFIVSLVGLLLNMPRRGDVDNASSGKRL
jgi:archaellum biogenesis protein FlaJ (TadC family)